MYIFNIYEVEINILNNLLISDGNSEAALELVPLNSAGFRAPFRSIKSDLNFICGKDLVSVKKNQKSKYILKSKFETGKVEVKIDSKYFLYPNKCTFIIKHPEAS